MATNGISLQGTSLDIWSTKYRMKDKEGNFLEETVDDTFKRVAKALASVEGRDDQATLENQFLWALRMGAIPAGRIMSNLGAEKYKPNTSTINCTVSSTVEDSMRGITTSLAEAGMTLAAGCGIGYDFSTLRPKGAFVAGVGATTSGALSFMNVFDSLCFTVASAGGRRGAQMATLDISHPDVFEFIAAKREAGKFRQFNLSLLITDEFMQAVMSEGKWKLTFPKNKNEKAEEVVVKPWPYFGGNMETSGPPQYEGTKCLNVVHKVYREVEAKELWDFIMKSTYDYAEPGFILIDKVNYGNPLWYRENIRATNPCGEQPLPPYGACLLGSINLTSFVANPFSQSAKFAFSKFAQVVRVFTRMLDNVADMHGLPLEKQREEIASKRRHGMGFFGLGSAMSMLKMRYGSKESLKFASDVSQVLVQTGWEEGVELAIIKGSAEALASEEDRKLFVSGQYMQKALRGDLLNKIRRDGCRFTHHSSIAPTGTISLSFGNNASNGIEPSFSHEYMRNVIREGKATKEQVKVYSYEALLWNSMFPGQPYPDYFSTSENISPEDHIAVQAAVQPWIDSAISKTVNVPTDFPFEDFKSLYLMAYNAGLKGCTTFRFNPEAFQGVLVTPKDLDETIYSFTLDSGEVVELRGSDPVVYDGAEHTAANLYDAIKEGYYGKL